jgi:hypothetical protein
LLCNLRKFYICIEIIFATRTHTHTHTHIYIHIYIYMEVGVTLRLTVCLGIEHPYGTCDQILVPVGMLLSEICGLVSLGRPPTAICSVITLWFFIVHKART